MLTIKNPVKLKLSNNVFLYAGIKSKFLARAGRIALLVVFLLSHFAKSAAVEPEKIGPDRILTTINQLHHEAAADQSLACPVRLEGIILWISPARDQFILQDDSGGIRVEMDLRSWPELQSGQKILLEGSGLVSRDGLREALVNNDGLHSATEKSQTIYLAKGRHPIRLDCLTPRGCLIWQSLIRGRNFHAK